VHSLVKELKKNITQVNNAFTLLQRNIYLVLDSVLHAQSRNIKPQTVLPSLLLKSLKESKQSFPWDIILPFPLIKDSTSIIYRMCKVQVYIQNGRLSYIVSIPLTNKGEFKAYHLVPVPIPERG
jgi:hypothetical protein